LPTIRLFNEASHQLPPQNHERIIAKQPRFHTARVIRVDLSLDRRLPLYAYEQTSLSSVGMIIERRNVSIGPQPHAPRQLFR
jgi:hypothetical protein